MDDTLPQLAQRPAGREIPSLTLPLCSVPNGGVSASLGRGTYQRLGQSAGIMQAAGRSSETNHATV